MNSGGRMKETFLPPEQAQRTVVCPTFNRWKTMDGQSPGIISNLVGSVAQRFSDEGLHDTSRIVVGDCSPKCPPELRAENLAHAFSDVERQTEVYVLVHEMQQTIAREVAKRLRLPPGLVDHMLVQNGYAQNRTKTEMPVMGDVVTLDDDTRIPREYYVIKNDQMPGGYRRVDNSQLLLSDDEVDRLRADMEVRTNKIAPFFEPLGKTVGQLRAEGHSGMQVSTMQHDDMNSALSHARENLQPAQFRVTNDPKSVIADADDYEIAGVTPTKHDIPDYRTIEIALAAAEQRFPEFEVPVRSVISGDSKMFGFQKSSTNVDSAALARRMDERTAMFPWWYLSSETISATNPHQMVRMSYRADNEFLPHILEPLSRSFGKNYIYASGIETQVTHHRARTGNRPGIEEQAASSLIGNVAATEAVERLHFDQATGHAYMEEIPTDYVVPEEKAGSVYRKLVELAYECRFQMDELDNEQGEHVAKLQAAYRNMAHNIESKLARVSFHDFHDALNKEVGDQLRFFREILAIFPKVRNFVQEELVAKGKYPVQKYVSSSDSVSVGSAGVSTSMGTRIEGGGHLSVALDPDTQ